jgi:exodeoxyribonuclease VII large subunit
MQAALETRQRKLEARAGRLDALSPLKVLERGYALARTAEGHVVTDAAQVAPGDELHVRVARGELEVRVQKIKPEGDE